MILAVDMGNSNIVIGVMDDTNVIFSGRIGTDRSKTGIDFLIQLKTMLDVYNIDIKKINTGILSSVVSELTVHVKKAMEQLLGKKVMVIGAGIKTGLNIKIDNPSSLGSDLVVDAVAALEEYSAPLIIFDFGTATTVSVIDNNRQYIGGMIIPGIKISQEALAQRTSQLPRISIEVPRTIIGKNTIECMQSGIIHSNAAMMDGIIDRINDELDMKATVVVTGGLSATIIPFVKNEVNYEENLLLKGLYYIYKKNC